MGELLEIVGQIQLWSQIWQCLGRFHGSSHPYIVYTDITEGVCVTLLKAANKVLP